MLVEKLVRRVPGLCLSTDLIVGFPGETDADFEATLSLLETVRFHSVFSFKYSSRPNTLAAKRMADDVPEPEKTRRIVELQARQKDIQTALHARTLGGEVVILIDGESRRGDELSGRTSGNTVVNVPGPASWIGRFAAVRVTRTGANSLSGVAVAVEGENQHDVAAWATRPGASDGQGDAD